MTKTRGKYLLTAIVLAARDAAKRFAPRRVIDQKRRQRERQEGRRDAWSPIVLRWMRKRKPQGNVATGLVVAPAKVGWFPQFHFHFAAYSSDRVRGERLGGGLHATGIHQTRVLAAHHWHNIRRAAQPLPPRQTDGPWRDVHAHRPVWPSVHAGRAVAARVSRPPAAQLIAPWPAQHTRLRFCERMLEVVRVSVRREEQTQLVPRLWQIRQRPQQASSKRGPAGGEDVPPRSPESRRLQFQFERAAELIWRQRPQTLTGVVENGFSEERSVAFQGPAARSLPSQEMALAGSLARERATEARVTSLDPGLLDRLTNDVIRRVEQRIRIERERRGL
jgi:hypothetical protein